MGRSRSQRKGTKVDDCTDEDTLSTASTGSSVDFGGVEIVEERDEETILDGFVEALYEKRASTRETGLKGLVGAMTSSVMDYFVEDKYETLLHLLIGSVKRGSSNEKALASRVVGLMALTAGPGAITERIMKDTWAHLVKVAKTDTSPPARVSALDTMGVLQFVGDTGLVTTENAMGTLWQICSHKGNHHSDQINGTDRPSGVVKAAAISSWALLLSTVPTTRIGGHYVALSLPTLSSLLKDDDLSVRTAAGEAVALLYDATKDQLEERAFLSDGDIDDNPEITVSRPQVAHKLSAIGAKGLEAKEEEVVEQIKALSVQPNKGLSRKERQTQRTAFRDLLMSIEDGVCREVSVKLQFGDFVKIKTWTETIQLNAFRRMLAEGFQRHLQDNVLLHQIFRFEPVVSRMQAMDFGDRRMYLSPKSVISKERTQIRNRNRSIAQASKLGCGY